MDEPVVHVLRETGLEMGPDFLLLCLSSPTVCLRSWLLYRHAVMVMIICRVPLGVGWGVQELTHLRSRANLKFIDIRNHFRFLSGRRP